MIRRETEIQKKWEDRSYHRRGLVGEVADCEVALVKVISSSTVQGTSLITLQPLPVVPCLSGLGGQSRCLLRPWGAIVRQEDIDEKILGSLYVLLPLLEISLVLMWDYEKGKHQNRPEVFLHRVWKIQSMPVTRFLYCNENSTIRVWTWSRKRCMPWLALQFILNPSDVCHQGMWLSSKNLPWPISWSQKLRRPQDLPIYNIKRTVTSITRWEEKLIRSRDNSALSWLVRGVGESWRRNLVTLSITEQVLALTSSVNNFGSIGSEY